MRLSLPCIMHFTIPSDEGLPIRGELDVPRASARAGRHRPWIQGVQGLGLLSLAGAALCKHGCAVCRFNMSRSGIGEDPESFDRLDLFAGDTYSIAARRPAQGGRACAARSIPASRRFSSAIRAAAAWRCSARDDVPDLAASSTWSAISRVDRWDEATRTRWRQDGCSRSMNARTKQMMRDIDRDARRRRSQPRAARHRGAAATRSACRCWSSMARRDESVPVAGGGDDRVARTDASR